MRFVPISTISIAKNRQRREFDAESLVKLSEGIRSKGLMHPIVCRITDEGLQLVAGERRLRAIGLLQSQGDTFLCDTQPVPVGSCPVVLVDEMDELMAWEAELEENVLRQDLSWQERVQAEASLHELRTKQAEARGEVHTIRKTVDEIAGPKAETTDTRANIILAHNLHNPEIGKAKSAKEAFKILKRNEEAKKNAEIAAIIGKTFSAADHRLENADSLVWLKTLPAESVDVVLTDPPYGMGADEFGDAGGALAANTHAYSDSAETLLKIMATLPEELYRVAKAQAHLYCFCDIDQFHFLRSEFQEAGWRVHRTPLIWHKPTSHRVPWPTMGPRRHWETILYAVKGDRPVMYIASDVLSFNTDENLGHPAQKPVGLLAELLSRSAGAGATILDPFMGTGSTIVAAHGLKMTAFGCELSAAHYGNAVKRIRELK